MVIENLELLEDRISKLLERFHIVLKEKSQLEDRVEELEDTVKQKDAELDVVKQALKNKGNLEEVNQQYEEERSALKTKTLNILSQLEQLESLLEENGGTEIKENMVIESPESDLQSDEDSFEEKVKPDPLDSVDEEEQQEESNPEPTKENRKVEDKKNDDRQQTLPFDDDDNEEEWDQEGQEHNYGD